MQFKYIHDTKKETITFTFDYPSDADEPVDAVPFTMMIVELNKTKLILKFVDTEEQATLYRQ